MAQTQFEIPVRGMDCAECTHHVQRALAALPGVQDVRVLLTSEKVVLQLDPAQVDLPTIRKAIEGAGYSIPQANGEERATSTTRSLSTLARPIFTIFGLLFGAVLLIVVVGEWLGFFERVTDVVPWYLGWGLVVLAGYPVFWNILRASLRRQVLSHTLKSLGSVAAFAVGQWPTAMVMVFFMRIGDYVEHFTTERSRQAVKGLSALDPQTARVERHGEEQVVPIAQVQVGETVLIRPGESIPVDGKVLGWQATVNQAAITGEAMPVEVQAGSRVFAATIATLGNLRVEATHVGAQTTFERVIKMVEEAEAHRAPVQSIADRFSASFLPVVATIALLTFLTSQNPFAAAAVLVVACSCSFALATPIAMLASIGAAASQGLLVKGGKYLEALSRADVLLIDKTGTITEGRPQITDVVALAGSSQQEVLTMAASAERHSEHPLAEAVRAFATAAELAVQEPDQFEAVPGMGILARVNGVSVKVGNARLVQEQLSVPVQLSFEQEGKTLLFVERAGTLIGVLAVADTVRPEVPMALERLRAMGIKQVELLTGDHRRTAEAQARSLGIAYRAELLPEDKTRIVKAYQQAGHTVMMVGDGVNDAPALA